MCILYLVVATQMLDAIEKLIEINYQKQKEAPFETTQTRRPRLLTALKSHSRQRIHTQPFLGEKLTQRIHELLFQIFIAPRRRPL